MGRCLPQDLIRLPQLADPALQRLDPLAVLARRAGPLPLVALGLADSLPERLSRAADLARDRADRCPLRRMIAAMIQHRPDRPLPDVRRKPVRPLLRHSPILSTVGASCEPGAVHPWARSPVAVTSPAAGFSLNRAAPQAAQRLAYRFPDEAREVTGRHKLMYRGRQKPSLAGVPCA
jgi:hypothetical protein